MSEEEQSTNKAATGNPYFIPGAIIIAGIVIAGAVLVSQGSFGGAAATGKSLEPTVLPVDKSDHVLGPKKPDVYLIEYSDYQCPFCSRFHDTVKQIMEEFDGRVAWVYRHFPLDSIHPEARPAAVAAECAADIGGEDAFWTFTDKLFEQPSGFSSETYTTIAADMGLNDKDFADCIVSGKYDERIEEQSQNAQDVGGGGTPHTVLLTKNGDTIQFKGALPVDQVRRLVERALATVE